MKGFLCLITTLLLSVVFILHNNNDSIIKKDRNTWIINLKEYEESDTRRYANCTLPTCWDLTKCMLNYSFITIYVQELIDIIDESGNIITPSPSKEFLSIRQSVISSHNSISSSNKACIVIPGIDFLNVNRFPNPSNAPQIIRALEQRFDNVLIMSYSGVWERSFRSILFSSLPFTSDFRPIFDISLPLFVPTKKEVVVETKERKFRLLAPLINISSVDFIQTSAALQNLPVSVLIVKECQTNITLICDQNEIIRELYNDVESSDFVLVDDRSPMFRSLLFHSLRLGSVPVISFHNHIIPFNDVIQWNRMSILPSSLSRLSFILPKIDSKRMDKLRSHGKEFFIKVLETPSATFNFALRILQSRLLPGSSLQTDWNQNEKRCDSVLPHLSSLDTITVYISSSDTSLTSIRSAIIIFASTHIVDKVVVLWNRNENPPSASFWEVSINVEVVLEREKDSNNGLRSLIRRSDDEIILIANGSFCTINQHEIHKALQIWRSNPERIIQIGEDRKTCQQVVILHKMMIPHWLSLENSSNSFVSRLYLLDKKCINESNQLYDSSNRKGHDHVLV